MTPERWQRLKHLFSGALDATPDEREAWLVRECDDESLVADARALLAAHDASARLEPRCEQALLPGEATALAGLDTLPPGSRVGPFRIEHEVGRGGMGVVYKAFDEHLQRPVAVKALAGQAAHDPAQRKRLQHEALLAATINHPGIAAVYRLDQIDGALYLATEYIEGDSLRETLDRGPLPQERALRFTRHILQALTAAHGAGVIHRDLKPDNVMVTSGDATKLVDFGIARSARFALTKITTAGAPGTPAYMAPEQLAGVEADARSDIYAVGVMLAEMVSGRHPGTPDMPSLQPPLQTIVDRSLAREPGERFQSAADMLQALEALRAPAARSSTAVAWWRFHQCAAATIYWLMLVPAWSARVAIGGPSGRLMFLVLLAAVVVSSILRFHQCFTSYYDRRHLHAVRRRAAFALSISDIVFVAGLAATGLALGDGQAPLMVLLLAVSVGTAVAARVVEPATTRAAFGGG